MPAEAGIQFEEVMEKLKHFAYGNSGIPAFAGMTALFFIPTQSLKGEGELFYFFTPSPIKREGEKGSL
jgi:hypothetical protein